MVRPKALEHALLESDTERLSRLFGSPIFFQKLISFVPAEHRQDLEQLLEIYQQEGQVAPQSFEAACHRLTEMQTLIQLYQITQIIPKLTVGRLFLRFAIVDPQILSPEQRQGLVQTLSPENSSQGSSGIFYQDEWLLGIAQQTFKSMAAGQAEALPASPEQSKYREHLQQFEYKMQESWSQYQLLAQQFEQMEPLRGLLHQGGERPSRLLSEQQRSQLQQLQQLAQHILQLDREYRQVHEQQQRLSLLVNGKGLSESNSQNTASAVRLEIKNLRRLRRTMEGAESTSLPLLHPRRLNLQQLASRARVTAELTGIERLDPGLFVRRFRSSFHRYAPRIVLLPSHAPKGLCWQAFDRMDRAHSSSLLLLPMYPADLREALVDALGQLRWMTAKQMAANYWLSEGLTGQYSSWLHKNKSKNNEQEHFVHDYRHWLLFESQGYQRLPHELRAIFWQWLPFPSEICHSLSQRHNIYAELHRRLPPGKKLGEVKVSPLVDG